MELLFTACVIFVHAATRKEIHTIRELNILFISKVFKIQSCIQQFTEHSLKQIELLCTRLKYRTSAVSLQEQHA